MKPKRIIFFIISITLGSVFALFINAFILDKIFIPDPCYYHSHNTNKVFDIFYELTSDDNGHPFPTKFNFIFTITVGAIIGLAISKSKLKHPPP